MRGLSMQWANMKDSADGRALVTEARANAARRKLINTDIRDLLNKKRSGKDFQEGDQFAFRSQSAHGHFMFSDLKRPAELIADRQIMTPGQVFVAAVGLLQEPVGTPFCP